MQKIVKTTALGLAVMMSAGALAEAKTLKSEEIKSLVDGKRVYLKVPIIGGEFPLKYAKGGKISGDGTGVGLAKYFSPKDTGVWWIKQDRLCQKWNEWYKGKTTCFVLSDLNGKNFRWKRDDGRKGRARVE